MFGLHKVVCLFVSNKRQNGWTYQGPELCAHCDLKVSSFQTKIDENYANYFFKTKTNNKWFIVQKCTWKWLQKSKGEFDIKIKAQGAATL